MRWRFFEENDLNWILGVTRDMFNESEWENELEYNTEKVTNYFFSALSNPNLFGIIGMDKKEKPIGFLTGMIFEYTFSDSKYAREMDLYIVPSERGGMMAIQLMKKFIDWSKSKGAKEVYFEPSTNGDINKFDKMAKRLGMKREAKYRSIL